MSTPSGRALAGKLAVLARYERDILRDRVRAGVAGPARLASHPGGRRPCAIASSRFARCSPRASANARSPNG